MICVLLLIVMGCKEEICGERDLAVENAENVIHYHNILGVRDIAMRLELVKDWNNSDAINKAYEGTTYEMVVLDPEPCGKPAIHNVPVGWDKIPCEAKYYSELRGDELIGNLQKLVERSDSEKPWGKVEVIAGYPIEDKTDLSGCWIVPFIFAHDHMVAPLAGSGAIFRIDVILDCEYNLISVITTGGQTWIS